ncbi:hypothetical protein BKA69DRAFT_22696 [Paraphysoderma sedebokerense]|nr:hypothetical protein BKA69DRAFT_22696 [Paraphysoderma sedebokerense]
MINELLSEKQSDTTDESISSRGDKSAFEKKIMSELKETKRQLKRYEEQIAKRYKNKNHVASDTLNDVDSDLESTDSVTKDLVSKWKAQNEAMK